MKKFGIPLGIVLIILLFIGIICIAIAAEVGILLLVGIEFENWKYLVSFIILYGIIEFALVMVSDVLIELKSEQLHRFHQYFAHMFISFTLLMTISLLMESIYLPLYGGIVFAIGTATLYLLFNSGSKKGRAES
ncbi:histidine kinase [Solibacillus merdavium]|uniref:Histidine kinase n=1 Tax=Solibacillus merdavium TaxID=2762218 RepID=A0ABR8XLB0_9BACL|nr:histidine kinase [Solibacillus merdavium]MBD8032727.1 histidine kinase [Solibacillus merdavium]